LSYRPRRETAALAAAGNGARFVYKAGGEGAILKRFQAKRPPARVGENASSKGALIEAERRGCVESVAHRLLLDSE